MRFAARKGSIQAVKAIMEKSGSSKKPIFWGRLLGTIPNMTLTQLKRTYVDVWVFCEVTFHRKSLRLRGILEKQLNYICRDKYF